MVVQCNVQKNRLGLLFGAFYQIHAIPKVNHHYYGAHYCHDTMSKKQQQQQQHGSAMVNHGTYPQ